MHPRSIVVALAIICGVTLSLSAKESLGSRGLAGAGLVTFTAHDYGYTGPDRVPAGMTTVEIINQGQDPHHAQLVKLAPGKTLAEFHAAMKQDPLHPPQWVRFLGGPNAIFPGDRTAATMRLDAGQYLILCLIPDKDGVPHVALGMEKAFVVTPARTASLAEPSPDLTITQHDFHFTLSKPITAGMRTIQVVNAGSQPHEVVLVKLEPGMKAKDFIAAVEPAPAGPPPGRLMGGIVGLDRGDHGFFQADFAPGSYGLICFFRDPKTGVPHFAHGMALDFTVK